MKKKKYERTIIVLSCLSFLLLIVVSYSWIWILLDENKEEVIFTPETVQPNTPEQETNISEVLNDYRVENNYKSDNKKYSEYEEEVWQYCMDRWDYYDKLNGGYSGDKYTEQVFKDAGIKFGISSKEADNIWTKVDKSKMGL